MSITNTGILVTALIRSEKVDLLHGTLSERGDKPWERVWWEKVSSSKIYEEVTPHLIKLTV